MTDNTKAIRRLSDINFEHEGAHVALVFAAQGGPANGVTTLITKATEDISEEQVRQMVGLEKAAFNSEVRDSLRSALQEKFQSGYEWLSLEDFSASEVIFYSDAGHFIVGYSLSSDDEYVFDDEARGFDYAYVRVENEQVKLSNDAQEKLSKGEYVLVNKALENPETSSNFMKQIAAITEKKQQMEVEIQKAVDAKNLEIAAMQEKLDAALALVEGFKAEKQATVLKAREAQIGEFVKEGAVDIAKATEHLDDEAFALILKAMGVQKAAVAESDLMKEVSNPDAVAVAPVDRTAEIIKARNAR